MTHYELYKDTTQKYRWRLLAGNNRTIADSGESYLNKQDAIAMIEYINSNKFTVTGV